ncbi:MAG: 50S ribosomal protein L11 methyltransferase [Proteobacteria bacterium]|nr:50S ribosomal protein L11 methyltransferase [Pseudomonadota bacterium]
MWLSVTLDADAEHADALSDALLGQGAITVSVEDALAGTPEETPQFGEPGSPACGSPPLWSHSRVIALFEPGDEFANTPGGAADDLDRRIAAACASVGIGKPATISYDEVAEQNWVQLTQSQFEPIRINERLWIVPSWHAAPDPAAINLLLDPGMAFGTGSHPTTRLCLEWLCVHVQGGESVLDYGCGSGILAIAAARLGAGRVLGVDIDDNALTAARDNASANGVSLELRHSRSPLEETFDCVVANILTNPLCVLAPLLSARLATGGPGNIAGGRLALSGVLESQADEVIAAYASFVQLKIAAALDGWILLEGQRQRQAP